MGVAVEVMVCSCPGNEGEDSAVLSSGGYRLYGKVPQPGETDSDGVWLHYLHQDRQQVEHCSDRSHDLLQRSRGQHPGATGPARQVRE